MWEHNPETPAMNKVLENNALRQIRETNRQIAEEIAEEDRKKAAKSASKKKKETKKGAR